MSKPGIQIRDAQIALGESGRGRKLVTVPVPGAPVAEIGDRRDRIRDYAFQFTRDGAPVAEIGDRRDWSEAQPDGKIRAHWEGRLISLDTESGGIIVRIPDQSGFRGGWRAELAGGAVILAQGQCAQGLAGRMGSGPDMLVRIPEGGSVTVHRSGRLYGGTAVTRFECREGAVVSVDPAMQAETKAAASAILS